MDGYATGVRLRKLTLLSEFESNEIRLVINSMFVMQTKMIINGGPRIGEICQGQFHSYVQAEPYLFCHIKTEIAGAKEDLDQDVAHLRKGIGAPGQKSKACIEPCRLISDGARLLDALLIPRYTIAMRPRNFMKSFV